MPKNPVTVVSNSPFCAKSRKIKHTCKISKAE